MKKLLAGNMLVSIYSKCRDYFAHCCVCVCWPVFLFSCATGPRDGSKNTSRTFTTVVVDAGHGGKDNGAYRRYGGAEKIATLDVAKRLDRKLRESQLKTVLTRSSDVFVPLDERVAIENSQKSCIFVSIHFNDSRRRGVHGFETYYHSRNSSGACASNPEQADDDSEFGKSRRAHSEFSRPAPGDLSRRSGRMRISEQPKRWQTKRAIPNIANCSRTESRRRLSNNATARVFMARPAKSLKVSRPRKDPRRSQPR